MSRYFLRDTVTNSFEMEQELYSKLEEIGEPVETFDGYCYTPRENFASSSFLGMLGYSFVTEREYQRAIARLEEDGLYDIAVYLADDFDLGTGPNGEDVFRNGECLGYITVETTYDDFMDMQY